MNKPQTGADTEKFARYIIGLTPAQAMAITSSVNEMAVVSEVRKKGRLQLGDITLITKECGDGETYIYKEVK